MTKKMYVHATEDLSALKERNSVTWDNMDGPGGHYANELNLTEKDKYLLVSFTCGLLKLKESHMPSSRVEKWLAGSGGGEIGKGW